ncbi:MAG: hypothetical protein HRU01_01505 [Myxococcales bacterium]|nr:hypothetical protein [Myxococcales bacterium]
MTGSRQGFAIAGGVVLVASCAVLLRAVVAEAWIGEDAFITFRTIDNFVQGYGLRWNVDERVQTYTHPLWLLLNLPLYAFIRDIPWTSTILSLFCTAAAFLVAGSRYWRRPVVIALGLFVPLVSSISFLRYSTSGFENSLSHLCFAGFAMLFLRALDREEIPWGGLAFLAALGVTNRLDAVLVYAPPLALLLLLHYRTARYRRFLLGLSPIFGWLAFSTIYYGFPYPNTGPAKLNTGFPEDVLFQQGTRYALDLMRSDWVGFVVMGMGGGITIGRLLQALAGSDRRSSLGVASLGAGAMLYAYYVVSIGGAWLSGRHWTLPIFVMTLLCAEQLAGVSRACGGLQLGSPGTSLARLAKAPAVWILALSLAASAGFVAERRPTVARKQPGIRDMPHSAMYLRKTGEWRSTRDLEKFRRAGRELRGQDVAVYRAVGVAAFEAERTIIVDPYALTDPLLARLPAQKRPGGGWGATDHYARDIPPGYLHARRTGSLERMPEHLANFYAPLRRIITEPVFDTQRLQTLVAFNRGSYDHHRAAYLAETWPGRFGSGSAP